MVRPRNFSAGPAQMPEDVLLSAQAEFMDFAGTGMSVLETSHRSAAYRRVIDAAEASLREEYDLPSYEFQDLILSFLFVRSCSLQHISAPALQETLLLFSPLWNPYTKGQEYTDSNKISY